jgi:hypothetical protein
MENPPSIDDGWSAKLESWKASQGCIMVGVCGFSLFAGFVALHDTPDYFKKESIPLICSSFPSPFAAAASHRARPSAGDPCRIDSSLSMSFFRRTLLPISITD